MRRGGGKKRRDSSEPAIVHALRAVGGFVRQCHGDGAPDLIVRLRGKWLPIECKSDSGKIRKGQEEYPIARTAAEALALWGIKG